MAKWCTVIHNPSKKSVKRLLLLMFPKKILYYIRCVDTTTVGSTWTDYLSMLTQPSWTINNIHLCNRPCRCRRTCNNHYLVWYPCSTWNMFLNNSGAWRLLFILFWTGPIKWKLATCYKESLPKHVEWMDLNQLWIERSSNTEPNPQRQGFQGPLPIIPFRGNMMVSGRLCIVSMYIYVHEK